MEAKERRSKYVLNARKNNDKNTTIINNVAIFLFILRVVVTAEKKNNPLKYPHDVSDVSSKYLYKPIRVKG